MKVSILVPIYRVENYIERCAVSILNQSYDDLEIIFVDDCSPDNSMQVLNKVIKKYPKRISQIKIIKHNENKGLAEARKTAVNAATGQYVFHLDSDDYLELFAIEYIVKNSKLGFYDIVMADFTHIYNNKTKRYQRKKETSITDLICNIIKRKQACNIWGNLIRKELYDNLDIPKINNGEDYVTMPRLLYKSNNIDILNVSIYNYTHENQHSFQFNRLNQRNVADRISAVNYLENYFLLNSSNDSIIEAIKISRLFLLSLSIMAVKHVSEFRYINDLGLMKNSNLKQINIKYRFILYLYKIKAYNFILLVNKIVAFR